MKKYLFILIFLFLPSIAHGATNVYYSVGQNTDDHKTGSPTIQVSGYTATLSVGQTAANMGVGDVITYNDGTERKCYISGKTSPTIWNCTNATGGTAPQVSAGTSVTSIAHVFDSLSAAISGADDLIGNTDLTAADVVLNIPCYYDSVADATAVTVSGYTTGENNYIKIYTPTNTSTEVNTSQRHQGEWDEAKYRIDLQSGTEGISGINIQENYTEINGLQIYMHGSAWTEIGIYFDATYVKVFNSVLRGDSAGSSFGISNGSATNKNYPYIVNNIAYNQNTGFHIEGLWSVLSNNTASGCISSCYNGSSSYSKIARNNIANPNGGVGFNASDNYSNQSTNNASSDNTVPKDTGDIPGNITNATLSFVSTIAGSEDFHLTANSSSVLNAGLDLTSDGSYPFSTDIDNQTRPVGSNTWDIGADERLVNIYYSVGQSNSNMITGGSSPVTVSGYNITFGTAQTGNIGVGDKITYASGSCYISGKNSQTVWSCANVTGGTAPQGESTASSITRAFTSLNGALASADSPSYLNTGNLVTAGVRLNIPCYYDTAADTTAANTTTDYTTGTDNYIKIYTPYDTSTEVNFSQRHQGKWDDSKYRIETSGAYTYGVYIAENYVRVEGLQIKITNNSADGATGINATNVASEVQISHNIIKGVLSGTANYSHAIYGNTNQVIRVWNNVVYGFITNDNPSNANGGIYTYLNTSAYVYNNTVYNCTWGIVNNSESANSMTIKNNVVQGCASTNYYNNRLTAASGNNITGDATNLSHIAFGTSAETGTTTSSSASKLIDSGQNFLSTVFVGMLITDSAFNYAYVTAVDSNTQLSLSANIMGSGEAYTVYTNRYGTVSFVDSTNRDFHLSPSDTLAKNAGMTIKTSGDDANLYFTTDIDGSIRPDSSWDAGADEFGGRYRSVGVGATSPVSTTATGGSFSISGMTGTFTTAPGTTIGVGDAIEYDDDNDGDIDANDSIAFITARTSATTYVLQKADGTNPTLTAAATTVWNIYRAYTSLSAAEAGTENTGIDSDLRAFDTGNVDLVTSGEQWNIACYANGTTADSTAVEIEGWTTGLANYIKVYTPIATTEVGVSQRHQGKWDTNKYRIEVTNDNALYVRSNYVKIDGLQITSLSPAANGKAIVNFTPDDASSYNSSEELSNSLLKGNNDATYYQYGIIVPNDAPANLKIWNNIIYDINASASPESQAIYAYTSRAYFYNNTIYGGYRGLRVLSGTVVAKNNLVQNAGSEGYTGTFDNTNSTNNLSNLADAPGVSYQNSKTVIFSDSANDDYHLAVSDTSARNLGADLSLDSYISITTDIDGHTRSTAAVSGAFDIGADEGATGIYRSVGAGATAPVATTTQGGSMIVSGTAVTFGTAPGTTIGVGDAIQYSSANNATMDAIVFITSRTDSTHYVAQKADGSTPTVNVTGNTTWGIYRAYTSFFNAEAGIENSGLNDAIEQFDDSWSGSGGKDISTSNEQWNISCYANGTTADTTATTINGWTTGVPNYLKIYTPVTSTEVGTSQRHQGKWDDSKYHFSFTTGDPIQPQEDYVRLEGLQILMTATSDGHGVIFSGSQAASNDIRISNNIIRAVFSGATTWGMGIGGSSDNLKYKIYNNIIYGFINGDNPSANNSGITTRGTAYVYNNTVYNSKFGINVVGTTVAKNNLIHGCVDGYVGSFSALSDFNISNVDAADAPNATFTSDYVTADMFLDKTNYDLHLKADDTYARNVGTNLSSDTDLAFSTDVDSQTRNADSRGWDIGADEAATQIYYSVGDGAANDMKVASTVSITNGAAVFSAAQTGNIGVGDVISYGAGPSYAYITAKTNADGMNWTVQTVTGAIITGVSGQTVNSIKHTFSTLNGAVGAASGAGYLNTVDLYSGNYILNIPCYYDSAADTAAVTVSGYTTTPSNYIKLYTPSSTTTEANFSQRHQGVWESAKYNLTDTLEIDINNVTVDGLESIVPGATSVITYGTNTIRNMLIKNSTTGIYGRGTAYNNIITGCTTGILGNGNLYSYNNTLASNTTAFNSIGAYTTITNSLLYQNATDVSASGVSNIDQSTYNSTTNSASAGLPLGTGNNYSKTFSFEDSANNNFHLASVDTGARNLGSDLSATFSTDIDGHTRPTLGAWDIGADEGAAYIYYSVGQSTATNLITAGTSPVTVSGYNITFGTAQTGNIGVGDKITYGANSCFISGKQSSTIWNCTNATGGTAPQGASSASSINRAFSSLNQAIGTSGSAPTLLGTADLKTNNYVLNIPCYYDSGGDMGEVIIDGFTNAAPNYIKIYTPNNVVTEINTNQRHSGVWSDTKYNISAPIYPQGDAITIQDQYVKIIGLQLKRGGTNAFSTIAIEVDSSYADIQNNIMDGAATYDNDSGGIKIGQFDEPVDIYNNIIYDFRFGIYSYDNGGHGHGTVSVYNNTMYDNTWGFRTYYSNDLYVKNNLAVGGTAYTIEYNNGTAFTTANNISSDATSPNSGATDCGGHSCRSLTVNFADATNKDFHLTNNNATTALNAGADLSSDANIAFSTDIDGQNRAPGKWDIGADENNNVTIEMKRNVNFGRNVNFK